LLAGAVSLTFCVLAQAQGDALAQGFKNPPDSAKPP
jgi:hypothetical protein